ncbi:odorant receptor 13a-like [Pieris brassicae]|uniref:odorant receptor 13a-like n=1 Tax=Pieris brassicae TaxID=7116 RepID=UPI001E65EAA3|nr:odorant receptor 13a-like [Pieris brassicae]
MGLIHRVWIKLTPTTAVQDCGREEIMYFEYLYRVIYLAGLSFSPENQKYYIYSNAVKAALILLFMSELWQFLSRQWTLDTITDSFNILMIQLGAVCKYRKKLAYENVFKRLASSMSSPNFDLSTDERKKLLEVWQRRSEANLKLLLALGTCTVIPWHIYPLVDDLDYNLMVPIRLPFSYQNQLRYQITYFLVIIVFSYMSYFVMVNDLIIQAHVMHLLCQYSILGDCFRHILKDCKLDFHDLNETQLYSNKNFQLKYKKRIGDLIRQHKFILNNTLDLRDILSAPMLVQLAVSTILICSIGYQLVATSIHMNVTKWLMSFLYLGYNMFGLYILCRWCEEVKIQSKAIGDAVYFSRWEDGITQVPGIRSSILMILARCNKPLVLSAGGMYDLSLQGYATIVKTSYSALTVLLRFRQN